MDVIGGGILPTPVGAIAPEGVSNKFADAPSTDTCTLGRLLTIYPTQSIDIAQSMSAVKIDVGFVTY